MLFLQGVHVCTAWTNSFFARFLRHKMLFLQGLHLCRAWRNGIFCTGLHGLPTPAPAHLIGSPNPLVSRAPQTLTQKGLSQAPGIPLALKNASKLFFFQQKGLLTSSERLGVLVQTCLFFVNLQPCLHSNQMF